MRLLFVHQNFPGQYRHIASRLARDPANDVVAIGEHEALARLDGRGGAIRCRGYSRPEAASSHVHPYVREFDCAVRRGQEVLALARGLKREGFIPDIICAHAGWGEALFLKDVFPNVPILGFFEFFYADRGADVGFDPEFPGAVDDPFRLRVKNTIHLHGLDACDWGVTPTRWQLSRFPATARNRMSVVFDGVDTDMVRPNVAAAVHMKRCGRLSVSDEVITYVARNLEPYRGFHVFMRSLPRLLRERSKARVVIVGGNGVSYGRRPAGAATWREAMLAELGSQIDLARVHFVGQVSHEQFVNLLQISSVHVYLTYPFVLSWSMVEAMAAGCLVVGSATPPVQEVIEDGVNGLLVDFFSPDQIVEAIHRVLEHPTRLRQLRTAARQTAVERYDLDRVCLPRQMDLIRQVVSGRPVADFETALLKRGNITEKERSISVSVI